MKHDKQATHHGRAGIRRVLGALAFLMGGFTAELARPVNCNLLHRPAARQPHRKQEFS
ncbi:MAG TPA: hypothetical protein VGC21_08865 [Telluria sp.]